MSWNTIIRAATLRQFLVTTCLGSITFGAYLSWTSPVLPQLQNQNSTMPFTLTVEEGSWVGSMLAVGILCSSIPSGYLADRFGLKRCIIGLIIPNAIFTLMVYFSKDVYSLFIGRFISDISEVSLRGSLGSFFSVLINLGIIFVTVCGAYVNYITLTIIIGTSFVMLGITLIYFPESPTYLIKVGRKEQAIVALKYYRSDDYDVAPDIDIICKNVQDQIQQDKVNIKKVFTTKSVVRGVIACVGLTIFQQLSAIDAIIFYTVQIFHEAETDFDSYTSAIIFSVVQLLSNVVMIFLMNKAGRRIFLYLSVVVCGLSLATLGMYFHLKSYKIYFIGISYIPIISLIVYGVGFTIGIGPLTWLITGELLPPKIKRVTSGITLSANCISLFVVTKTFPIIMQDINQYFPFYFYAFCMALCLIFVRFCVPETKACLGSITYGAYLSWTSPILPQLQNQNSTMPFTLTVEEGSWVGSMLAVGILCSSIPSGYLADRFGLKRCIIALIVPNAIFTLIVYFSKDVYSLCIGRFMSGTAAGGSLVIGPMYIADISEVSLRGSLGCFFSVLIYVGIIFVTVCGAYVNYITLTIILGTCFVMLGIALMYFPESPTYLIKVGRKEQAILALKYYRSDDYDVTPDIDVICTNVQEQRRQDKVNIKNVFTTKSVVRSVIVCVGLTIFQQFTAIDAIVFYTVQIFHEAETDLDSYTSAIIFSVVQLLSSVVMVFLMNRAGRRTFLYLSVVVCGLSLATLGVYFQIKSYNIYFIGISYIPLISLLVYGVGFTIGIGPLVWLINGELLPPKIKGVTSGITLSANCISLFIVTKTFPIMMQDINQYFPFYFYALCMALCLIFVQFCVPETKGKTLDQIQIELST
ncbi:hypothetical protein FQR65_LT05951 [Abscondita terminalis]|nr:hypothetical protein FQR65_LT05951 [Abscondita terminalis]